MPPILRPRHDPPVGATPPGLSGAGNRVGKKTLAAVVGLPVAAALLSLIPSEESGRTVQTKVDHATVISTNVSGNQHRTAYRDVVGIVTICDGDTSNVRIGQTASEAECRARLEQQLINHARPIMACVPALANTAHGDQLIASVSLAYNIGPGRIAGGGFCGSTAARLFNAGQWRAGCDAFLRFNRAGGRVIAGLDSRRRRERAICVRGL